MREKVFHIQKYHNGYRLDKQLLLSIEEILKQHCNELTMYLDIECENSISYTFNSIEECFSFFETCPYKIIKLKISATLKNNSEYNEVSLKFDNTYYPSTEAKFSFNNSNDYLLLKNKIEICLKNFKLNYRLLTRLPLIPILLSLALFSICAYTSINSIVYPSIVQTLIILSWYLGFIVFIPPINKLKRKLFPCTEFIIGQNEKMEEKYRKIRNFLICTVAGGTILGIMVNLLTELLF